MLPDEGGNAGLALIVGCGCDVPAPDRVVTQPQATEPDAVTCSAPAVRITVLVDVAVQHVEVADFLSKLTERIASWAGGELSGVRRRADELDESLGGGGGAPVPPPDQRHRQPDAWPEARTTNVGPSNAVSERGRIAVAKPWTASAPEEERVAAL